MIKISEWYLNQLHIKIKLTEVPHKTITHQHTPIPYFLCCFLYISNSYTLFYQQYFPRTLIPVWSRTNTYRIMTFRLPFFFLSASNLLNKVMYIKYWRVGVETGFSFFSVRSTCCFFILISSYRFIFLDFLKVLVTSYFFLFDLVFSSGKLAFTSSD